MAGGAITTFGFVRIVTKQEERLPVANTTKNDLVVDAAYKSNRTQVECTAVANALFAALCNHLASGHTIELRGFGTLRPHHAAPRPGRNVHTGEIIPIPARKTAKMRFPKGFLCES